jgi:hypothetical protein
MKKILVALLSITLFVAGVLILGTIVDTISQDGNYSYE